MNSHYPSPLETIPETQIDDEVPPPDEEEFPQPDDFLPDGRNLTLILPSEYTASEGGTRYRRPDQDKTKKKNKEANKEGKVKKAARKIKATASGLQNYKRLKLRNTGRKVDLELGAGSEEGSRREVK
ncbi:hypothetical protein EYC84_008692 [Monilinia fructicola]|uniref:Uncharacterized protein n=1 Tax=Monilinia fructicola TaxID=38448 RepID=A0A5M9J8Y3_MONFR|nr:hypothetical protein EYC84_008692 [Monilinia fructicola]